MVWRTTVILTVLCFFSVQLFAGGRQAGSGGGQAMRGPASEAEANMKLTSAQAEPLTLPIVKDKITIGYMGYPEVYIVSKMTGYAEMEIFQELERRTNIRINWREEPFNDHQTKVNLMFSTGEPEDLVFDAHLNYPGGAKKLLDDGLIVPLNWYIEHYAPNLKKLLLENHQLLKEISIDDGRIYMFPEIRVDAVTRANNGFALRKDWLDKLGLKAPATIEEWYTVLKAFKEKDPNGNGKADEIPFTQIGRPAEFGSAFGILDAAFFLDGDKVVFAPFASRYREYVETLAKWYREGLLDPEIFTQNGTAMDAKMTGDIAGAYWGAMAGKLGRYLSARYQPGESSFDLVPTSPPLDRDGKYYVFSPPARALVPHGASVGMNNKYIIETTKWADYYYSKEGSTLINYGIEGKAHTVQNGREIFTDLILKNPNGLTIEEASVRYAGGSMIQIPGFDFGNVVTQLKLSTAQQRLASEIWANADTSRILPTVFLTESQTREASTVMSDANTYREEMVNKFIMGQEPLGNFPRFIDTLKGMGVEKIVGYYNDAYQRWLHD
ncbi:MAG: extracellular solute-binding protein [Treponema sp.]|jgi:putative aldouronate transport system substrate-binding protein|nr:extracellular solute-binding protein [Treponema sp.]